MEFENSEFKNLEFENSEFEMSDLKNLSGWGGPWVGEIGCAVFIVDKSISLLRTFFGFQFRIC